MTDGTQRQWVGFFYRPIAGHPAILARATIGGSFSLGGSPFDLCLTSTLVAGIRIQCGCGRTTLIRLDARSRSRAYTSLCALHFTSLPGIVELIAGNPNAPALGHVSAASEAAKLRDAQSPHPAY
jgi:hypothetical protein